MFDHTNSAVVCDPTGDSAHEAGDEKIHRILSCSIKSKKFKKLANIDKDRLIKLLQTTVCLIVDKLSLISNKLISEMKDHIHYTAHGKK